MKVVGCTQACRPTASAQAVLRWRARIAAAKQDDATLLGKLLIAASSIATEQGIAESGFRLVINNGPDGGETVPHLHIHLLGGRPLDWPPG